MEIEEQLWRTFQSKFAKLLNKLPKEKQKELFYIFRSRKDLASNFYLEKINDLLKERIKNKIEERKRTKSLRVKIGIGERNKQMDILSQSTRTYAKLVFENRKLIARKNHDVIRRTGQTIYYKSVGCELYPICDKRN